MYGDYNYVCVFKDTWPALTSFPGMISVYVTLCTKQIA